MESINFGRAATRYSRNGLRLLDGPDGRSSSHRRTIIHSFGAHSAASISNVLARARIQIEFNASQPAIKSIPDYALNTCQARGSVG